MKSSKKIEDTIETNLRTIEKIAKNYSSGSIELEVLRYCSFAYYICMTRYRTEFEKYIVDLKKPLSPEEEEKADRYMK